MSNEQPPKWATKLACRILEADPEDVWVQRGNESSHSGPGWYASLAEYPEEGSVFLGGDTLTPEIKHFLDLMLDISLFVLVLAVACGAVLGVLYLWALV
jgi:hypothetical protein